MNWLFDCCFGTQEVVEDEYKYTLFMDTFYSSEVYLNT